MHHAVAAAKRLNTRRCLCDCAGKCGFFVHLKVTLLMLTSVTRFGEISLLWQNIIGVWHFLDSLLGIWLNCEPTLVDFLCCWANYSMLYMTKNWKNNLPSGHTDANVWMLSLTCASPSKYIMYSTTLSFGPWKVGEGTCSQKTLPLIERSRVWILLLAYFCVSLGGTYLCKCP